MITDAATPPTALQRIDMLLADIRADRARDRELANPHRPNPMVAAAMGGDAQTIAELRAANGALAREVVALKQALWKLCQTEPWHVVRSVEQMPGGSGPDFALVTLRDGTLLEVGDEGVNAWHDFAHFTESTRPPLASVFFRPQPEGGA